jgi:glycerophosphoryl diester phosphodiesterase
VPLTRAAGEPVPTLDEVLDVALPKARLLCELKNDTVVPAAVAQVRARGLLDRVTFISFNIAALGLARAQGADVKLGYLLFNPSEADIAYAQYLKAESIDMDYRRACYHVVRAIHGAGLLARCWTPNEPVEYAALAALGIDSITTDRPDLLLKHLGRA